MSIEFLFEGEIEFDEVLRNERKKKPNIPIVYFMVHSKGRPFVVRNERLVISLIGTVVICNVIPNVGG